MNEDGRAVLAEARKVLETEGWIQGDFYRNGKHCAEGAMQHAAMRLYQPLRDEAKRWDRARTRAVSAIGAHLGGCLISEWNDEPERTVEDVIQLFKEVERELEGPDSTG